MWAIHTFQEDWLKQVRSFFSSALIPHQGCQAACRAQAWLHLGPRKLFQHSITHYPPKQHLRTINMSPHGFWQGPTRALLAQGLWRSCRHAISMAANVWRQDGSWRPSSPALEPRHRTVPTHPPWLPTTPELVRERQQDKEESEEEAAPSLLQWVQVTETHPAAGWDGATQV